MQIAAFAGSDVGRVREGNEDSYHVGRAVFAVADGMGGHQAGEVASETALEPVASVDGREFATAEDADVALAGALRAANRRVVDKAERDPDLRGMGTTLTAVLVRAGHLHVAHVGDSRAYLLRSGEPIRQLTTDHTLVERLVQEGRLSREDAATHPQRNVITRAIGNERAVDIDTLLPVPLEHGDQVLLCSDGLTGPVDDEEIARILENAEDGDEAVAALIDAANDGGGQDNITVVLLRVSRTGARTIGIGGRAGATRAAATDPTEETPRAEVPSSGGSDSVRQIRTRTDASQGDWASAMGRLGAQQGVDSRGRQESRAGRGKRVVAGLLAAVLLLAVIGGGGWFLLSRAYFVGAYGGQVAVFRGLPQEVGGFQLSWVLDDEVSDVNVSDLPVHLQQNVSDGLSAGTIDEARRIIVGLERQVEQSGAGGDTAPGSATESPDPGAATPAPTTGSAESPTPGTGA